MNLQLPFGVEIELLEHNGAFQGLGTIRANGETLRSGGRPMFVEIRTPRGDLMRDYRLSNTRELPDGGSVLEFSMNVESGGLMEWMVHEIRPRYNTSNWTSGPQSAPNTSLSLEIHPLQRQWGENSYVGFSYRYSYRSEAFPIYKITDRATWEIGGNCVGSEFWQRNCFVPSITRFQGEEDFYSSEWYIPDCANPSAFQFLPLQTELQGFSFSASPRGVLVTWPNEVAHVRSLFEKARGEGVLAHFHEHCGDLSGEFQTSPVEVLFCAGEMPRVEWFNAYEAARDCVHETLHNQLGMRRERVSTYGQIEEWTMPDLDYYGREGVPKLLDAGCETIYVANHFENNMNTWGVSNMCCTVDYKVAGSVGADKLRALCDQIHDGGARVEMWGNTSISTLTWIFAQRGGNSERIQFLPPEDSIMAHLKDSAAPFVRNASNALEADHYTPIFCVLNLRDPAVRDYWNRRWRDANQNVGLDGIFLDSSFNLSSDKFHWVQNAQPHSSEGATADQTHLLGNFRPQNEPPSAILSQYRAHLELMREMQEFGYRYCNEDLGVFGTHRHGPAVEMRLDCLPIWSECIAGFDPHAIERAGGEPDDVFFRGLAYRQMWAIHWNSPANQLSFNYHDASSPPSEGHLALFKAYNRVNDAMRERLILPDETGVLWSQNGSPRVLWTFADMERPSALQGELLDVLSGEILPTEQSHLARHRVYQLQVQA